MNTILLYTSPARGHLYPMMDVALALHEQGHKVVVQTLADERDRLQQEGLIHEPIATEIEQRQLDDYKQSNPIAQIKAAFSCWMDRAKYEVADLEQSVATYDPDLLIVDVNTWGAATFAEAQGNPWVMFTPYCLPISSPDTPAFGPGFAPPKHALHRLRDRFFDGLTNKAVREFIQELNALRQEWGVPRLEKYEELLDRPNLVLYRTAEPFDYPRENWPKHILPIGPGLWAPEAETPDWLADLPRPRILVSVSTEKQDDGAIIETAIEAFGEEQGSLIVTSAALNPARFESSHPNIHVHKFLPHAQVIPEMDLVITHGGMGTTQRALAAGVPVCVIPWGRDQRETARRVEVSGAGAMVPRNKLNPSRLREAAHTALQRSSAAQDVANAFQQAGGAKRAVTALEPFLCDPVEQTKV